MDQSGIVPDVLDKLPAARIEVSISNPAQSHLSHITIPFFVPASSTSMGHFLSIGFRFVCLLTNGLFFQLRYETEWVTSGANELTPVQAHLPPQVTWPRQKAAYYTLCMIDPDVPSRCHHQEREWLHWLVVNIPGRHIYEGDTRTEYIGPEPSEGTGDTQVQSQRKQAELELEGLLPTLQVPNQFKVISICAYIIIVHVDGFQENFSLAFI